MAFVFALAGWLIGIAVSCLAELLLAGHKLPDWLMLASFGFVYLAAPAICLSTFVFALFNAHRYGKLEWRPGLGLSVTALAVASFVLQSWRFWGIISPHASIRPMGYAMFAGLTSIGIFLFGLLVSVADIAVLRKPRWVGVAAGVVGIGLALLPFWCDQAIMQHFLQAHHLVMEE
jgi:hypothetical protein